MWYSLDRAPIVSATAVRGHWIASFPPALCACLGVLAAAEILFARAAKLESSTKLDASWESAKKRRGERHEAEILRNEAERLVEHAGVDPKAWETAR